jgi:lipoyl-dependent peroxiredoxin
VLYEKRVPEEDVAIADRTAETVWQGPLGSGKGAVSGRTGAIDNLPVTWAARTEQPGGLTSPEELAAAAHSSCFSMALALRLGEHKVTPDQLSVVATVSLDDVDGLPTITSSTLRVRGRVPGIDAAAFRSIVDEAAKLCPVSRLFAGARITIDAELESL